MTEKIISITEASFDGMNGFLVTTSEQVIKLGIDNFQSCCEDWGYFMSEDDTSEFVGATLLGVDVVGTLLKTNEQFDVNSMYEGDVMFVNLKTNRGLLQFVAYNQHNGYYGHGACVISKTTNFDTVL